jgi:hypothetical protein
MSISTSGSSHCLQRLDCIAHRALVAHSVPNARADTGGSATRPSPAALHPIKPSGPTRDPWASHCTHPDLARGGNAAVQLNPVSSETSTSRINLAMAYPKPNRDSSAMAAGGHGHHVPVPIELGRNCRRSETHNCKSGKESKGAHMIANDGVLIRRSELHKRSPGQVDRLTGASNQRGDRRVRPPRDGH